MIQTAPVAPTLVPLVALNPAAWNPRSIKDDRFQNLCRSIDADPAFLWRRPVLAQADVTIYAGNMRFRAAQHLGMTEIPAIVEDVPDRLARERASATTSSGANGKRTTSQDSSTPSARTARTSTF